MGIISGEPNWFLLIIMDILEKLHIIKSNHEMTPEEMEKFKEMMEAKGFYFEEESN